MRTLLCASAAALLAAACQPMPPREPYPPPGYPDDAYPPAPYPAGPDYPAPSPEPSPPGYPPPGQGYPAQAFATLRVSPPQQGATQGVVIHDLRGEWPVNQQLGSVEIRCGEETLASISPVATAQ